MTYDCEATDSEFPSVSVNNYLLRWYALVVEGSHATKSKEAWASPLPNHRCLEKASSYKVPLVSDRSREREAEKIAPETCDEGIA